MIDRLRVSITRFQPATVATSDCHSAVLYCYDHYPDTDAYNMFVSVPSAVDVALFGPATLATRLCAAADDTIMT